MHNVFVFQDDTPSYYVIGLNVKKILVEFNDVYKRFKLGSDEYLIKTDNEYLNQYVGYDNSVKPVIYTSIEEARKHTKNFLTIIKVSINKETNEITLETIE